MILFVRAFVDLKISAGGGLANKTVIGADSREALLHLRPST